MPEFILVVRFSVRMFLNVDNFIGTSFSSPTTLTHQEQGGMIVEDDISRSIPTFHMYKNHCCLSFIKNILNSITVDQVILRF